MPLRVPNFELEVDSIYAAIDEYVEGGEHSYAQGSGAPPLSSPPRHKEKEEEEVEGHRAATGGTAAEVDRILKRNYKSETPPN